MINKITCIGFQDIVVCRSATFKSMESFLKFDYTFKAGKVYAIVSDFGCGSWGLVTSLGGRNSQNYTGKVFKDDIGILPDELLKYSAFIGENTFNGINSTQNLLTTKECIEKALTISRLPLKVTDVKNMFHLSDERFERNLKNVSGEINRISIAIHFALGKDIFCFPWQNEHDIKNISKDVLEVLKQNNKITLIPTSQKKKAKQLCDNLIVFREGRIYRM